MCDVHCAQVHTPVPMQRLEDVGSPLLCNSIEMGSLRTWRQTASQQAARPLFPSPSPTILELQAHVCTPGFSVQMVEILPLVLMLAQQVLFPTKPSPWL